MNWLGGLPFIDRSEDHDTLGDCPGCGGPMVSPSAPRGYGRVHCRACVREIEERQEVRQGRLR